MLAPSGCGRLLEPAFGALQERIRQLYHRPYLAKGAAERALLTLKALLEVCLTLALANFLHAGCLISCSN